MASSRATSPTGNDSTPSSPELSPRSKIQALLATVDSSDDDDSIPIDVSKIKEQLIRKPTGEKGGRASPSKSLQEEEDEEEDEDIIRPRGRFAAQMRAGNANLRKSTSPLPEDARRALKQLSRKSPTPTVRNKAEDVSMDGTEGSDEELPIFRRQRKSTAAHSVTPETRRSTNAPQSSPLFVSPGPQRSPTPSRRAGSRPTLATSSDSDSELPEDSSKAARFQALVARKREARLAKEAEEARKREERIKLLSDQIPAAADNSDIDDDASDITDDDGGRKMTQKASRPAVRKASRKALEEMNRETQRLSRSLQLAHEAKTKKKISKGMLFERFNFKPAGSVEGPKMKETSSSRPSSPFSALHTDVDMKDAETPPSSPPIVEKPAEEVDTAVVYNTEVQNGSDTELPSLADALAEARSAKEDKGKGIAKADSDYLPDPMEEKLAAASRPKRQFRVKLPPPQVNVVQMDADDELEITGPKQGRLDKIFSRVAPREDVESKSMHTLRRLAHLSSPTKDSRSAMSRKFGKKNEKPSMTVGELQLSLQQRAREQAKLEKERRLDFLRSKGIHVLTEEEREKEREQVEDIVARARKEAEEIMDREKEQAKKERKEKRKAGELDDDALGWDSSDDDSFEASEDEDGEENVDPVEIEMSGSEDEDADQSGADEDEEEEGANPLFDDVAEDDSEAESEAVEGQTTEAQAAAGSSQEMEDDDDFPSVDDFKIKSRRRAQKHVQIVSDDSDSDISPNNAGSPNDSLPPSKATPNPKSKNPFKSPTNPQGNSDSPQVPTSVLRSASKPFIPGMPVNAGGPAGLGLTQIFAGTMDESQTGSAVAPTNGSPVEFMPSIGELDHGFPDSQFSATADDDHLVMDSQPTQAQGAETQGETQGVQFHLDQSQMHGLGSLMREDTLMSTQMSDCIQPTQDGGFQNYSPLKTRFVEAPASTVETVKLDAAPDIDLDDGHDSPLVKRSGRLRRRADLATSISNTDLPPTEDPHAVVPQSPANKTPVETLEVDEASAFRLMQRAAKRAKRAELKATFNKKNSNAKEMVEDQAEESEDEYAGLGGADGEDDDDSDAGSVKEMIDDAAGNDIDEPKLAAFYADRERAADSKAVDKLFHDITTGMLRKRRGAGGGGDYDLSDSDDGGEARRKMKRRQFAKMQKALFTDERIGKIAENPRNAAFLKCIEDQGSEDEMDWLEDKEEPQPSDDDSQSQNKEGEKAIPDSQPMTARDTNMTARKRTREAPEFIRPPPALRRTKDGKRPASLGEIRESLSSLLEDPNGSIIPATADGSGSEASDEEDHDENERRSSVNSNKENRAPGRTAVIDRISLKRSNTGSSTSSTGSTSRLAFAAPSASGSGSFKVPALLKRATTNSLMTTTSSSATSTAGARGGAFGDEAKLKKTAGKKSGINYFARENERRAAVAESDKRREKRKWKGAEGRSKVVGGLFGGGSFE